MTLEMRSEVRILASPAKAFHKVESPFAGDVFGSAAYFIPKFLSICHHIEKFQQYGLDTAVDSMPAYVEEFKEKFKPAYNRYPMATFLPVVTFISDLLVEGSLKSALD
jgi:hypothetical protein